METTELYYPQIAARAGPYTFNEGIEIEVYSAKSSYFDWAKIRFTGQFRPEITLNKKDPAAIQLGTYEPGRTFCHGWQQVYPAAARCPAIPQRQIRHYQA